MRHARRGTPTSIRLHDSERIELAEAARLTGQSMTQYIRSAAVTAARRDLGGVRGSTIETVPPVRSDLHGTITPGEGHP